MWPNKNSSREDIVYYIKHSPIYFLNKFSDKPWAQPYIDEAAKKAAKVNPIRFLINFSNKPWAQPYIDETANKAAKNYTYSFLYYFSDKPWAQPYIDEAVKRAAKKDPKLFLEKMANKYPQGINWALFALGGENESV